MAKPTPTASELEQLQSLLGMLSPDDLAKMKKNVVNKATKANEDKLRNDPDFVAKKERMVTTARDQAALKQALKPIKVTEADENGEEIEVLKPCRLQKQINNAKDNIAKWTRQIKEGTAACEPGGHMYESAKEAKADFEAYVQKTLGGDNAAAYLASLPDTAPEEAEEAEEADTDTTSDPDGE